MVLSVRCRLQGDSGPPGQPGIPGTVGLQVRICLITGNYTKFDQLFNPQCLFSWFIHGVFQGPRGLRGLQGSMGSAGDRVSIFKAGSLLPASFSLSAPLQESDRSGGFV